MQSAMVFPVVMYGCESCTIKKAEHQRIDGFELWCWRRLLRVPWTDGEALYSQQKQDQELTVAQIMSSLCKMGESRENHKTTQVWTKSNPLLLNSGSDEQIQGIRSDRVPVELWTEVHAIVQEAVIKTMPPKKRNAKRQNECLRRPYKVLKKEEK